MTTTVKRKTIELYNLNNYINQITKVTSFKIFFEKNWLKQFQHKKNKYFKLIRKYIIKMKAMK